MPSYKDVCKGQHYGSYTTITDSFKDGKYYKVTLVCKCGKELIVQTSDLRKFTTRQCRQCLANSVRKYVVGATHGNLTIVEVISGRNIRVRCACGKTYQCITSTFRECKCCILCNKAKRGHEHPSFKGVGDVSSTYFSQIRRGAAKRHLEFSISMTQIAELLKRQNNKCAISGLSIELNTSKRRSETGVDNTASLDRIDSTKGYSIENVQWVHKDINFMKQNFSVEYFLEPCRKITEHKNINYLPTKYLIDG